MAFQNGTLVYDGPVKVDETKVGGKMKNMHAKKNRALSETGNSNKSIVVGIKCRQTNQIETVVVETASKDILHEFIEARTTPDTIVYIDSNPAYTDVERTHETVNHKVGEYVRDDVHTQGMESL